MGQTTENKMDQKISIVVPAYNEAENIQALYTSIINSTPQQYELEIIFVDDGSSDSTMDVIHQICSKDQQVKFISLSRNFGHQHALKAGLDAATGDCAICLDADLQHPPSLIGPMLEYWKDGADIVNMLRRSQNGTDFKNTSSALFYRLINLISDVTIKPGSSDFRLIDRKPLAVLQSIQDNNLFLRGTIPWIGFKQVDLLYEPNERKSGTTKYTLRKMFSLALSGITSSSTRPLRITTYIGLATTLSAVAYAIYVLLIRIFTDSAVSGWASVLISILFMGGIQLIILGIMGEYIAKIYDDRKSKPAYLIKDKNF